MNRRLCRKAIRRGDLDDILRYGIVPATIAVLEAFERLPEATREAIIATDRLARALATAEDGAQPHYRGVVSSRGSNPT